MNPSTITFLLCVLSYATLYGQDIIWTGTATGGDGVSWEDADNWNTGMLPGGFEEVLIANDSVSLTTIPPILRWIVLDNAILNIENEFVLNNNDSFAIQLNNGSKLINNYTIDIEEAGNGEFDDRGIEILTNSIFINNGMCRISDIMGGYAIRLESGSNFENNGPLHLEGTGNLIYSGSSEFTNNDSIYGTLNIVSSYGVTSSTSSQIINNGFISLTMQDGIAALVCFSAGQIHNYGEIMLTLNDCNYGVLVSGVNCEFHHYDGNLEYGNANLFGLRARINTVVSIATDAILIDHGGGSGGFIEVEEGADFTGEGVMQLGNE